MKTQAAWRARNPDDAAARRLRAEIAAAKAGAGAPVPRGPPTRIPWKEMKDEISPQALVIAGFLVRLVLVERKDQRRAQVFAIMKERAALVASPSEDQTDPVRAGA